MYGVFLIVILIITGGAIAFIGDRLGTKVGKKKLSIFGLRPKHTSILVTILTGISITTTTLGIMTAVSDNVRTALFGMEKLQQTMRDTEERLANAAQELEASKAEQHKTDEALKRTKSEVGKLQAQRDELEQRAQELQAGNIMLEQSNRQLVEHNNRLAETTKRLEDGNIVLQKGNDMLRQSNEKLAEDNKALADSNYNLATGIQIMREGAIAFRAGEVLSSGVIRCGRSEAVISDELRLLTQIAKDNISRRLGDKATEAEKQIWIYETDYEQAAQYIASSKEDVVVRVVAAGNHLRGESVRTLLQLYRNALIYQDNELIARRRLNVDVSNPDAVEGAISSFLQEVNEKATDKGMLADPISGTVGVIDGEQIFNAVRDLNLFKGNAIITAYSKGTSEVVGPLRIRLKLIGAADFLD